MTSISKERFHAVVVGGGIAGLTAAFELQKQFRSLQWKGEVEITLLESAPHFGGVLQTDQVGQYRVEQSADMFTTEPPAALELCRELGLEHQLQQAQPTPHRAFVATAQGMQPIPAGFSLMYPGDIQAVLDSPILSAAGKARFLQEEQVPAANQSNVDVRGRDESLESFAVRRFGREMFDRLIQPLAAGIYTADPQRLSMQATMARFLQMEQQYGSLIGASKAAQRSARTVANSDESDQGATSGARYGLFRAPQRGIASLIGALVDRLQQSQPKVKLLSGRQVKSIAKADPGFRLSLADTDSPEGPKTAATAKHALQCDGLILATPAIVSGRLLDGLDMTAANALAAALGSIESASSAIAVMGIDRSQIEPSDFGGYGIIIPASLGRQVIAVSFASNKFDGRAPQEKLLLRVFVGGALQPELVDLDDDPLIQISCDELRRLVQFQGDPEFASVYRWHQSMPQYTLNHGERVESIESLVASIDGLELAGKSYRGVGIPACIESGKLAARRLLDQHPALGGSAPGK